MAFLLIHPLALSGKYRRQTLKANGKDSDGTGFTRALKMPSA